MLKKQYIALKVIKTVKKVKDELNKDRNTSFGACALKSDKRQGDSDTFVFVDPRN